MVVHGTPFARRSEEELFDSRDALINDCRSHRTRRTARMPSLRVTLLRLTHWAHERRHRRLDGRHNLGALSAACIVLSFVPKFESAPRAITLDGSLRCWDEFDHPRFPVTRRLNGFIGGTDSPWESSTAFASHAQAKRTQNTRLSCRVTQSGCVCRLPCHRFCGPGIVCPQSAGGVDDGAPTAIEICGR